MSRAGLCGSCKAEPCCAAAIDAAVAEATRELREVVEQVYGELGWHTDDDADPNDPSPDDAVAWQNGICRQQLRAVLAGDGE